MMAFIKDLKMIRCETILISKYRTELMGIATIMVLLCHARPNGVELNDTILKLIGLGQYGVNLFFFLSGIGIYYSLQKCESLILWYKRRILRLFIPYMLITIPILAFTNEHYSFMNILLRITTIGYWTGIENVSWFIAAIIPFYLLSPLINIFLNSITKYRYVNLFLLWGGSSFICSILLKYDDSLAIKHMIQTLMSFPSFILGMWFALYIKIDGISLIEFIKGIILFFMLFTMEYLFTGIKSYWLAIILIIGFISIFFKYTPNIRNILTFFGTISLESYLFNTELPIIFKGSGNLYYLLLIIVGTISSIFINKISKLILNKIK